MIRWGVLVASVVLIAGAAFVAGASRPPSPSPSPSSAESPVGPVKAEPAKMVVVTQKTGYFNMAKVMREYKRAKNSVAELNEEKNRLAVNIQALRSMYSDLQGIRRSVTDPDERAELNRELKTIQQMIEKADRDANKRLNEQASLLIVGFYDEIRAATIKIAKEHGLVAVLAFPDAVTPQELESPYVKELKLKPTAAQPFYLDPSVDYTDEVIRVLNEK
ncbi:MAG: OmpH family outer membrane protein [Planctomycetia bacterium]|nr:OmpH family outer membrane protein [Planctomycetia bacterium]